MQTTAGKKGRKNGKPPAPRTKIHNIKSPCIFLRAKIRGHKEMSSILADQ